MTRQGWTVASKFTLPFIIFAMVTTGLGWVGTSAGIADPGPDAPLTRGQLIQHQFDVVFANIFSSRDAIPSTPPAEWLPRAGVESLLADAARWWSDNTGLKFDFTTGIRFTAINTTCHDDTGDAWAAMGEKPEYYKQPGHNMLILVSDTACGNTAGDLGYNGVHSGATIWFHSSSWKGDPSEATYLSRVAVFAHEFGHNTGLVHSNIMNCANRAAADDRVGPSWDGYAQTQCAYRDYGDSSSIMGGARFPSTLNSLQRWYLGVGWGDVAVVDKPVTRQVMTIARYDTGTPLSPTGSADPRGIVISTPDGGFLGSLEYRSGPGFSRPGVYVTMRPDYMIAGLEAHLVNPAGTSMDLGSGPDQSPLDPGLTYVSKDGTVRLRTLSVDATTAQVEVTMTNQPGVQGMVSITQHDKTLTAVVTGAPASATSGYQWYRNGQPIPGATQATYTPWLPDPNAVYRVEATLKAAGHAATTRYSRGIIPDDHRLTANGTDLTLTLLDQDGGRTDCARLNLDLNITTVAGQPVAATEASLDPTAVEGVCRTPLGLPLTGQLNITAATSTAQDQSRNLLTAYWQTVTTSTTVTATQATARLAIGIPPAAATPGIPMNSYDLNATPPIPILVAGNGNAPLSVTVSVTNASGAPAAGVPVRLSASIPGLVLSDTSPVTDQYGFAHTTLDWNHATRPPDQCLNATVNAVVQGLEVAGSPTQVQVCGGQTSQISAWFDGKTSWVADGNDAARLRVRLWDSAGTPIVNQVDRLAVTLPFSNAQNPDVSVSTPVWDPSDQSYVVTVTSTAAQTVSLWVSLDSRYGLIKYLVPVQFTGGLPPTVTVVATPTRSSIHNQCNGASPFQNDVRATVIATTAAGAPFINAAVDWSADSPWVFGPSEYMTASNGWARGTQDGTASASLGLDFSQWSGTGLLTVEVRATVNGVTASTRVDVYVDPGPACPTQQPTPAEPTPTEPTPTKPKEPTPTELTPTKPTPTEPTPTEPTPTEPNPTEPTPTEPNPTEPTATEPTPTKPTPPPVQKTVTLSLSDNAFTVFPTPCNGQTRVTPNTMTVTATVTDPQGQPIPGAAVVWSTNSPILFATPTSVTGADGKAEVTASLSTPNWEATMTNMSVTAKVDDTEVSKVIYAGINYPKIESTNWYITVAPTTVDPVPADGTSTWTVLVRTVDQCGLPAPVQLVQFSITGNAKLAYNQMTSDINGWAQVTITDTTPEQVIVSATGTIGAVNIPHQAPITFGTTQAEPQPTPGTPPEPQPTPGIPSVCTADGKYYWGMVITNPGQSDAVSVQFTYQSTRGPLTIETPVRYQRWDLTLPDDAINGPLTIVARDAHDNQSQPITIPRQT